MSNQNQCGQLPSPNSNKFKCCEIENVISKKLHTFYQKSEFCDIVLIAADDFKLRAHRIILSAASDYFLGMFRSNLKEATTSEIKLNDIDSVTLKLIVEYMYTATIELNSDTIESVLRAADFFQIRTLIALCCNFMRDQLHCSNCLGIALFAEQHQYPVLYKTSMEFAIRNFEQVRKENEFLKLNDEQLSVLISDNKLVVSSEESVFLSLVDWLSYDEDNRKRFILGLLSNIRFRLLTPKFILENRDLLCKTAECNEFIDQHLSHYSEPLEHSLSRTNSEILLHVHADDNDQWIIQTYNQILHKWCIIKQLPQSKKGLTLSGTVVGTKLILSGSSIASNLESLDLKTKTSANLPPMNVARCAPEMAELNGDLYVVGGVSNNGETTAVEKHDFYTGKWQNVASLPEQLPCLKVASINGLLYAISSLVKLFFCYNPVTNKWIRKAYKHEETYHYTLTPFNGHLYAVGGVPSRDKTVERYNPINDTWTVVNTLRVGLREPACTAFNNRLVVCSNFNINEINLVQEYNPETDEWRTLAPVNLFKKCSTPYMFAINKCFVLGMLPK